MGFKLTYATMFDPPGEMHERFEAALRSIEAHAASGHALFIAGREVPGATQFVKRSPIDERLALGEFASASAAQVDAAVAAAAAAFRLWRATPPQERIRLVRRVGELIEARVYTLAAALCLEVGKNRMEALGEAQESADFFSSYADDFERNGFYDRALRDDPITTYHSRNRSVLKPYGVWAVIAPFNFPLALASGPTAAALVTGNTVVLKGASDTPWAGRLLADCVRDAGLPAGVFNYVTGSGAVVGEQLVRSASIAGITFTGSYEVGMRICRHMASGASPRPCIAEMGGKNSCIVTQNADLDRAATGIVRSAFGMGGQKCSALSRLYVDARVASGLLERLQHQVEAIRVGDPRRLENWLGPVISARAAENYERFSSALHGHGAKILSGGKRLTAGDLHHGHYAEPLLAEAPGEHPLYAEEMFLPILMLRRVDNLSEALTAANTSPLGLTAGFYGNETEAREFLDGIEAGVTYVNRPQGATTGAWPGYQAFGGWKGSGSTGKAIGSFYYLPQYMREQSQTQVE
jgi:acyl-CoA reductase-like NAD-dependent aldehyde dehydrogenase